MHRSITRAADEAPLLPPPHALTALQADTADVASRALRAATGTFVLADEHGTGKSYILAEISCRLGLEGVVWSCATRALCDSMAGRVASLQRGTAQCGSAAVRLRPHCELTEEDMLGARLLILDDAEHLSEMSGTGRALKAVGHRVAALVVVTSAPFAPGFVHRLWSLRLGLWRSELGDTAYRAYVRGLKSRGAVAPVLSSLDLARSGVLSSTAFAEEPRLDVMHLSVEGAARRAYDALLARRAGERALRRWEIRAKALACLPVWQADVAAGFSVLVSLGPRCALAGEISRLVRAHLGTAALLTGRARSRALAHFQEGHERLLVAPYTAALGRDLVCKRRCVKQYILDCVQTPMALQALLGQCRRLGASASTSTVVLLRTLRDRAAALRCGPRSSPLNMSSLIPWQPECLPMVLLELFVRLLVEKCPLSAQSLRHTETRAQSPSRQLHALHALCAFVTGREWTRLDTSKLASFAATFLPLCARTHATVSSWLHSEASPRCPEGLRLHLPPACRDFGVEVCARLPADVWLHIARFCRGRVLEASCILAFTGPRLLDCRTLLSFLRKLQYVPLRLQDQVRYAWDAAARVIGAAGTSCAPGAPVTSVEAYFGAIVGPEIAHTAMGVHLTRSGSVARCVAEIHDRLSIVEVPLLFQDASGALAVRDARATDGELRRPGSGVRLRGLAVSDKLCVAAWRTYQTQLVLGRQHRSMRIRSGTHAELRLQCEDLSDYWEASARRLLYGRDASRGGEAFAGLLIGHASRARPAPTSPRLRPPNPNRPSS